MDAPRFVTLCFVYCGATLLATQALLYGSVGTLAAVGNAGAALCILFTGLLRLYSDAKEKKPQEFGPLAYGMVLFALLCTLLFLVGAFAS